MIPITRPDLPSLQEYTALLEEVWESRMLSNFGTFAKKLEKVASGYLGVPARALVSGDIGLVLALAALEIPQGSAVIVPSFTFNSTVNAILWNGLKPYFADVSAGSLTLDPASTRHALEISQAKAIVATHVFGNPADVEHLEAIARSDGVRLVFDAAHAYGARRNGQLVGGFGDAEVFSLSGTKLITSAEGGILASQSEDLIERLEYLRAYGFKNDYNSLFVGLNGKMSELHAARGTLTLPAVEKAVERRHELVQLYRRQLAGAPVQFQSVRPEDTSTYKDLALVFGDASAREKVQRSLQEADVQTKRYFRPCHTQPAFAGFGSVGLENTEDAYNRILCVPLYAAMTSDQIDLVTGAIRSSLS